MLDQLLQALMPNAQAAPSNSNWAQQKLAHMAGHGPDPNDIQAGHFTPSQLGGPAPQANVMPGAVQSPVPVQAVGGGQAAPSSSASSAAPTNTPATANSQSQAPEFSGFAAPEGAGNANNDGLLQIAGFFRSLGGPLGALAGVVEQQELKMRDDARTNNNFQAMLRRGVDPEIARIVARNPGKTVAAINAANTHRRNSANEKPELRKFADGRWRERGKDGVWRIPEFENGPIAVKQDDERTSLQKDYSAAMKQHIANGGTAKSFMEQYGDMTKWKRDNNRSMVEKHNNDIALAGFKKGVAKIADWQEEYNKTEYGAIASAERMIINARKGILTGPWAQQRMAIMDAARFLGIGGKDQHEIAQNTKLYMTDVASATGSEISQFGAGTGLSDADREFAQQMAGGNLSMTPENLARLHEIRMKVRIRQAMRHNDLVATNGGPERMGWDYSVNIPQRWKDLMREESPEEVAQRDAFYASRGIVPNEKSPGTYHYVGKRAAGRNKPQLGPPMPPQGGATPGKSYKGFTPG